MTKHKGDKLLCVFLCNLLGTHHLNVQVKGDIKVLVFLWNDNETAAKVQFDKQKKENINKPSVAQLELVCFCV